MDIRDLYILVSQSTLVSAGTAIPLALGQKTDLLSIMFKIRTAVEFTPTILIVEDETNVRALWARQLQGKGKIRQASTRREALDILDEEDCKADILFVDKTLNGDAADILHKWRSSYGGPVCLVSGNLSNLDERDRFYEMGVDLVIEKPISLSALDSIARKFARHVKQERQLAELRHHSALQWRAIIILALGFTAVGGQRAYDLIRGLL
jgi:response regulator RpfG family c-di-GMP phosphodiesterase